MNLAIISAVSALAGSTVGALSSFATTWLVQTSQIRSQHLTRKDGIDFLRVVPQIAIKVTTKHYQLREANEALADLRAGRFEGAAVLTP